MESGLFEQQWQEEQVIEALPESPWQREKRRTALFIAAGAGVGVALAVSLFLAPPALVVAGVLGLAFVVLVLASPFAGLLAYLACEFLRFGEQVPQLQAIHFQRMVILLVFGAWVIRAAVRRDERLLADRQNWTMLALLGAAAVSIFNPYWPGRSAQFTLDFAKMCLVYLAVINLTDTPRRLRQVTWALVLLVGWAGFTGIRRYTGGVEVELSGDTIRAGAESIFLGNSNDLALALVAMLPLAVYLFHTTQSWARGAALGLILLYGWSLVCTGSRGGFLGTLAVVLGVWLTSRRKVLGLVVLAAILATGWMLASPSYRERMASVVTGADPDGSMAGRIEAWKVGLRILRDRPLVGAGAGNFLVAYATRYTPPGMRPMYRSAHSVWFQTAGELGALGIVAFAWFLFVLVRGALRLRRGQPAPEQRALATAVLVSLFGLAVAGTFANLLWYPYFYLLAALCVVMRRLAAASETSNVRDLRPL